ncbi:MAG TPA: SLC26A/SulP transporter family protein [Burkholderiales bacterium]|nr:SLC26A/SulP transporter family protein [Burkholderiales bacterium]
MAPPPANPRRFPNPSSIMEMEPGRKRAPEEPTQPASATLKTRYVSAPSHDEDRSMTLMQAGERTRWEQIRGDLSGGITSAVVALPQTITIGALAFAPLGQEYVPIGILAGFYCSIVSGLVTAWTGAIPFSVGGPRSSFSLVMALILSTLMAGYAELYGAAAVGTLSGTTHIIGLAAMAVLFAGLLQMLLGISGIGAYIKFIPHPVVAGFMNGIAFLILASQLPYLAGMEQHVDWWDIHGIAANLHPATAIVGVFTFAVIYVCNRYVRRVPGPLAGVVLGTAFYYGMRAVFPGLELGPVVGSVPPEFPRPTMAPVFWEYAFDPRTWQLMLKIAPSIGVLAVLGALESLMCAVAVGQISGRRPKANRELLGQGLSNVVGSLFGAVFSGSTTSRTVLNYKMGGRTRLSGTAHSLVMLLALMTAPWWVAQLPHVVLAAVLAFIAVTMFDGWTRQLVKRLSHREVHREVWTNVAIVLLVTVATVAFNLVVGVLAGVIATAIVFISKSSKTVVRRIQYGNKRHSLKLRSPEKTAFLRENGQEIVILELEGSLFFGTADQLALEVESLPRTTTYVILDCKRVIEFDASGAHILEQISRRLMKTGRRLLLSHITPTGPNGKFLGDMGVNAVIPIELWFRDTDHALEWCENKLVVRAFPDDETMAEMPVARMGLAHNFTPEEVSLLSAVLHRLTYAPGQYLFREGDKGDQMFLLSQGAITIKLPLKKTDPDAESRRLVTLSPGVMFGEMVLVESRPRSADAVAEEYSVVYSLGRDDLEHLFHSNPKLATKLMRNVSRILADRLRTTTEELRAAEI